MPVDLPKFLIALPDAFSLSRPALQRHVSARRSSAGCSRRRAACSPGVAVIPFEILQAVKQVMSSLCLASAAFSHKVNKCLHFLQCTEGGGKQEAVASNSSFEIYTVEERAAPFSWKIPPLGHFRSKRPLGAGRIPLWEEQRAENKNSPINSG